MSNSIMSRVWEGSPAKGSKLIVLLALANWANDQGVCFPALDDLATKARLSRRQAQQLLKELEEEGEIVTRGKSGYQLVRYTEGARHG